MDLSLIYRYKQLFTFQCLTLRLLLCKRKFLLFINVFIIERKKKNPMFYQKEES
jgi:hypothetical protein